MASVRKRDGKWVVDYKDVKGARRLKTFTHKKAADAFRNKVVQDVERGEHVADRETVTIAEAADRWLRHLHKRVAMDDRMTRATVETYRLALDRMLPGIGRLKIAEIGPRPVQEVIDVLARRFAPATVRHAYRSTFMLCEFAVAEGWLGKNTIPQKLMRLPPKSKRIEVASKDDLRLILKVTCEREPWEHFHAQRLRVAVVALALFGGLRRGEICGLRWQDVDYARGVLHIRHSMSRLDGLKGPKTKAGIRDVPLSLPIIEGLRGIAEARESPAKPDDFVVTTRVGKRLLPTAITSDLWYPILKKAGLFQPGRKGGYRFHALRHAAVSLLIDQGLSPIHIKTMVGHASVTTTLDVYGHLFPQDRTIATAADGVAAAMRATDVQPALLTH